MRDPVGRADLQKGGASSGPPDPTYTTVSLSDSRCHPRAPKGCTRACGRPHVCGLMLLGLSNEERSTQSAEWSIERPLREASAPPAIYTLPASPFGERNKWPGSGSPFPTLRSPSSTSRHTCSLPHAGVHPGGRQVPSSRRRSLVQVPAINVRGGSPTSRPTTTPGGLEHPRKRSRRRL